jgi:hypothetical protein
MCSTITERTGGCDHMTCKSRICGGNTHFCYVCGDKLEDPISEHFNNWKCKKTPSS